MVARLWARLVELGEIGAIKGPNGEEGCARLALTDADKAGRDLVVGWMRDLGLDVTIDAIGNVVATRPGTDSTAAPVMCGSHIDTVATGGRFDGNLGVLAGLEVVETLAQHGVTTRRPIAVAFFTDEEGSRFAPDMLGSLVYVGGMAVEEALDVRAVDDGARLGDELDRIGYAGSLPCPTARPPHAYVELHIEQGPVLEDAGVTIGVVEGVQGISWTEVTIEGRSAHAGTTPMAARRDAGFAAASLAVHARQIAVDDGRSPGRHRRPLRGPSRPRQRRPQRGDAHGRPAQHVRVAPAAGRAPPRRRRRRRCGRRRGAHHDPLAGPLRAGDVRSGDRRPRRGDGRAPRALDAADAERRRPRRPDARPHLPVGDDLHPERGRPVAQHRRAHPPAGRRPPAPTSCCRRCSPSPAPT